MIEKLIGSFSIYERKEKDGIDKRMEISLGMVPTGFLIGLFVWLFLG